MSDIFIFQIFLINSNLQSTATQLTENHDLLSLQQRNPVDSQFWSRLCFLDNHLPRVPVTQNQEGTMEMRDEVLSSVGAQDLDTSSYQVSDLEGIEFNWESSQLDMDEVFRPGIDTPFSPTAFDDLSMEGSVENPIVLHEEEDKENAPPPSSTRETVRPTEPPGFRKVALLEQEWKMYPIMFLEICFIK